MHRFLSKSQRSLVSSMSRLPSPVLSQFRRGIVSFSRSSSSGAASAEALYRLPKNAEEQAALLEWAYYESTQIVKIHGKSTPVYPQ
jgi:hypothetical protein